MRILGLGPSGSDPVAQSETEDLWGDWPSVSNHLCIIFKYFCRACSHLYNIALLCLAHCHGREQGGLTQIVVTVTACYLL